ncbi:MAG TPA: MFS transporter [Acidobacteriota bacterium]
MTLNRLRTALALERNISVTLMAIVIVGMGEELWTRFLPKYLELLGATAWIIAAYGTLRDLLDAVYQYPGGWLADRLGRRAALMLFTLLAMIGYGFYLFSPGWKWILAGTFFVMAWSSLTLPALFAIIGDNLPPSRRAVGFGVQAFLKRVPMILAPPLGGWLIARLGMSRGVKACLMATLALALLAILVVQRYYVEKHVSGLDGGRFRAIWQDMDTHLKRLLVADCLARWAEGIPKVFIVLYVLDVLRGSAVQFGWFVSLQTITSIVVYIPIARLADRMNRKPFVLLTFAFFALFPLALVISGSLFWLSLAFVIGGLREIGEPARKALIVDLAKKSARGRSVGMYYLIRGLVVFPASLVGGWLWAADARRPFYAAFVIGLLGLATYAAWGPGDSDGRRQEAVSSGH